MASVSEWWARRLGGPPAPPAPPFGSTAAPPYQAPPPPGPPAGQDDSAIALLAQAAASTGGSERAKQNTGRCPECGGGNFFARKFTESGMPLRMEAAPRCYDCGYPVIQAGSSHGSASSVRASGPTQRARQLPSNHAVTVVTDAGAMTFPPN